jgi:hypothetical protein
VRIAVEPLVRAGFEGEVPVAVEAEQSDVMDEHGAVPGLDMDLPDVGVRTRDEVNDVRLARRARRGTYRLGCRYRR